MTYLNLLVIFTLSCSSDNIASSNEPKSKYADVTKVIASGNKGGYTFSVTLSSPDTGCDQYADWWEVLSEEGKLIYRRILAHSHVNEQPFSRSGGPVNIAEDQTVWIRGHMNNTGYGGQVMKGSVASGFEKVDTPDQFAFGVDTQTPLPGECAF